MPPKGYCQCGCGEKTKLSDKTSKARGWVAGQPRKFLRGHQMRLPEVVSSWPKGSEHGNWKEGEIGKAAGHARARKLKPEGPCEDCGKEAWGVHHLDHNPLNNDPANLRRLCQACHSTYHSWGRKPKHERV